ncbi:MAG: hypothetical protein Q8P26_01580 [Candidatus Levybacteria bacterium]|nr:hypothetical protein [Candidatus Levybacteria bacterium]
MGVKHKKTRKQKIIADIHRNVYTLEGNTVSINPVTSANNSASYSYVVRDISKTGLLSLSIIVTEIILFFLLKNHIITLPNLNY